MSATARIRAPRMRGEAVWLVSFRHRDRLTAELAALGCRVTAARRLDGLAERFAKSSATLVMIDLRGAVDEGLKALTLLSPSADLRNIPVIILYDRRRAKDLPRIVEAGASMVLHAPWQAAELAATVKLAGRLARQRAGLAAPLFARRDAPVADSLTGLADARALESWVTDQIEKGPVALLAVNVARFDMINAAFGSETGDAALRAIAHRIEPLIGDLQPGGALFARMRGAEFGAAVAGDVSPERLALLGEAIVEAVGRPFATENETVRLGCRIGIVKSGPRDRSAARLFKRAQSALAEAKSPDAGPIRLLIGQDAALSDLTATLQSDLRGALDRGEIDILFQPQVGIASGRIEGVEALARWAHPVHGEIGAATLFAAAEQSDFTVELSSHVQQRTIQIAANWPYALDHLRLSVNVTAADMAQPRFASTFLAMVDKTGFPRERLTVEVTESGLMEDLTAAATILNRMRAAGCRVAIDDFGTGYSSLAYLNALPADYLKIDKGLADDIAASERASIVVRSVIALARSLGLSVIAEGVESEGQLALLAREGCSLYQGFLRARPLDVAALEAMVLAELG